MKYIHVKNLEKYHPGYQDRSLIWCKAYFSMVNSDPEFEMQCEIDKWRFIAFTMLELQLKRPIPFDKEYLSRKGFDIKKRSIQLSIDMLHNFLVISEVRNETVTQSRVDKSRVDSNSILDNKNKEEEDIYIDRFPVEEHFEEIWNKYPLKDGKKAARKSFLVSVLTEEDWQNINKALNNYVLHLKDNPWKKPKNGSTWFNNWQDWINFITPERCKRCNGTGRIHGRGQEWSLQNCVPMPKTLARRSPSSALCEAREDERTT